MLDNHIGLWACPRSRTTVLARSFEQRRDCIVFDEPFYAAYLVSRGFRDPVRDAILEARETDPERVIEKLRRPLPENLEFALQKHISKNILPEFGARWLPRRNIFLIRDPREIVLSLQRVMGDGITAEDIDMPSLLREFQRVRTLTGVTPLVVDSTQLIKDPARVLRRVCAEISIPFSDRMLGWKPNLEDSQLFFTGALLSHADSWYGTVKQSTGFRTHQERPQTVPEHLLELVKVCRPAYEELRSYALTVD